MSARGHNRRVNVILESLKVAAQAKALYHTEQELILSEHARKGTHEELGFIAFSDCIAAAIEHGHNVKYWQGVERGYFAVEVVLNDLSWANLEVVEMLAIKAINWQTYTVGVTIDDIRNQGLGGHPATPGAVSAAFESSGVRPVREERPTKRDHEGDPVAGPQQ